MAREIFLPSGETVEKDVVLEDVKLAIEELLPDASLLDAPTFVDNELVDLLLLERGGRVVVVKIVDEEDVEQMFPRLIHDYAKLKQHLEKIKNKYRNTYFSSRKDPKVLLFVQEISSEEIFHMLPLLTFEVAIYEYTYIRSHRLRGLFFKERKRQGHKTRSLTSTVLHDESVMGELDTAAPPTAVMAEPPRTKTQVVPSAAPAPRSEKRHATQQSPVSNFYKRGKLTEEELVEFLNLETKLEEFQPPPDA